MILKDTEYAKRVSRKWNSNSPVYKIETIEGNHTSIHVCRNKADALGFIKTELHKNSDAYVKLYKDDKLINTYGAHPVRRQK